MLEVLPQVLFTKALVSDLFYFAIIHLNLLLIFLLLLFPGWLILIFVVSVLMVIYLMLFTVALGKVHATKDKINEPLVSDRPPSLAHPSETDLFIEKENESQSIKDAIMSVGRSISFSIKADMAQNNADEMTPLRSLSVA